MDQNRIFELALEALQRQKAEIERAIAEVREFQDEKKRILAKNSKTTAVVAVSRGSRTVAERKAHSLAMKRYWTARRAAKAKQQKATATPSTAKVRTKTDAEKKALSLKMKEAWRKRKAAAAKGNETQPKVVKAKEKSS